MKNADLHPSSLLLQTFFQKFDLFADAPDAVAKMRELVLHLAFSGQLVKSNSERKAGTLDSILAEASINGVSKGPTSDTTATEILKISAGTSRRDFFVNEDDFKHVDLPPNEVAKFRLEPGDLLACRFNGNLHYVGRFSYYRGVSGRTQVNPDKLIRFRIDRSKHCPRYVCYAMNSADARSTIEAMCATTAGNIGLSAGKLKTVEIPLPPLAEQKRIVAKVDELMALCDRLEAQQQEWEAKASQLARASLARFADAPTPANLDYLFHSSFSIPPSDLRKSILTLAVQGKLVPQDPNDDEPEAALLELHRARLRQAKAGKLRAAKVPANAFLEDPLPFIPDSWRTVSFDHLAVAHNNALKAGPFGSALKKEFYVEWGYKIYGQEQVIADDPFIGDYYIDEKKFAELESCAVSTGDILISLVGTIGKILVLPEGIEPGIINPRVIKLSLDASLVYPMFVKVLIGSPYAVDFFEENSHGGTMNILNLSILRALPLPLPPLSEQRRIVAKVEQLMALVDALETQLAASRTTAANLLSALVAELTAG
jgi:type I restriction enzyme S subunit